MLLRKFLSTAVTLLLIVRTNAAVTTVEHYRLGEDDPGAAAGNAAPGSHAATTSRHLTAVGTPRYGGIGGPGSGRITNSSLAMDFNGSSGLRISGVPVNATDNFGIEAWVFARAGTGDRCIAYVGDSASNGWGLYQSSNFTRSSIAARFGTTNVVNTGDLHVDGWMHVAMVRNAGMTTLYMFGMPVLAGASPAVPSAPSGAMSIGVAAGADQHFFDGLIDEVRVFTFAPGAFTPADLMLSPLPPNTAAVDSLDLGTDGVVYAMASQPDGKMVLGGNFTSILGATRRGLARLNADGTLDQGFDPNVLDVPSFNDTTRPGTVSNIVVLDDGRLVIGGDFRRLQPNGAASPATRYGLARLNPDGSLDSSFDTRLLMSDINNPGSIIPGYPLGLCLQDDGRILVSGDFVALQPANDPFPSARAGLARLYPDGNVDGFDPCQARENSVPGLVRSVAVQRDGRIVIAGLFTTLGPNRNTDRVPVKSFARLYPDGTVDPSLSLNPEGGQGRFVSALPDGSLLLGGGGYAYNPPGASPFYRQLILRVLPGGSMDPSFAAFPLSTGGSNTIVYLQSVALQADGRIVATGNVTRADNYTSGPLMRFLNDGTLDETFLPRPNNPLSVAGSVLLQPDGKVLFGSLFTSLQPDLSSPPVARANFTRLLNDPAMQELTVKPDSGVRWSRAGTAPVVSRANFDLSVDGGATWQRLGPGTPVAGTADWEMPNCPLPSQGLVRARGRVIGGLHNGSSGLIEQITAFPRPGSADGQDAMVLGGTVNATAVQPDGKTLLGGSFTSVLGVSRNRIARLNANGTLDTGFNTNANDAVNSIAVQPDGDILIGGAFTTLQPNGSAAPVTRRRIARLHNNGALDTAFDPNANGEVSCVTLSAAQNGDILAGGAFTSLQPAGAATATARNRIARIRYDGSVDLSFDPNADAEVKCIVPQPDGKILAAGSFLALRPNGAPGSTSRSHIARLLADGTLDIAFNPIANGPAGSIAIQPDGKVLLAGEFTGIGSGPTPRGRIARVNADGTLDSAFDPKADGPVRSLALQTNGQILLAGGFNNLQPNSSPAAVRRNHVARINSDGTLDPSFAPNPDGEEEVRSVAQYADGSIVVAGGIMDFPPGDTGELPAQRHGFALLKNAGVMQTLTTSGTTAVEWTRGGAGPDISAAYFELSTNGGATWTPLGSGTRMGITANWQLTGLNLPASGWIRAHGRTSGGFQNGSAGWIEQNAAFPAAEISVEHPAGSPLVSGVPGPDFGPVASGGSSAPKTFTIKNTSSVPLTLGALTLTGPHPAEYTLNTTGMAATIAAGESTVFTVAFGPAAAGNTSSRNAILNISCNDADENPFAVVLRGTALSHTTDTDGDGISDAAEIQLAALGFDWRITQPALVNTLAGNVNAAGYYSTSQIQALHAGAQFITRNPATNQFTLKLELKKSQDLTNFSPLPFLSPQTTINAQGQIEFPFTVADDAAFFRIEVK